MKSVRTIGWAACLVAVAPGSWARDLPRSDPDRAALLDAARDEHDSKFIVRDFVKVGDYAFFCALKQDLPGEVHGTDDAKNVYQYFFVREGGRWVPVAAAITDDTRKVPCGIALFDDLPRGPGKSNPIVTQGEADLVRVIVGEVQSAIRTDLDYGAVDPANLAAWELLGRKRIARDFSVEHQIPKIDPSSEPVRWQQRACKSATCRKTLKDALRDLMAWRRSGRASSLVWGGCWADRDLVNTRACVGEMSSRPYCRPRMMFVADRQDIDRCAAEVRRRVGP